MRTTVTLDADTEQIVRSRMTEQQVSFKRALDDAIRESLGSRPPTAPFRTRIHAMGRPSVNFDRALQLADEPDGY